MAKAKVVVLFRKKPKRKLGRHTKHINKHKSCKPNRGQG